MKLLKTNLKVLHTKIYLHTQDHSIFLFLGYKQLTFSTLTPELKRVQKVDRQLGAVAGILGVDVQVGAQSLFKRVDRGIRHYHNRITPEPSLKHWFLRSLPNMPSHCLFLPALPFTIFLWILFPNPSQRLHFPSSRSGSL